MGMRPKCGDDIEPEDLIEESDGIPVSSWLALVFLIVEFIVVCMLYVHFNRF